VAEDSFQEKTEKATPRRRERARKKGNVARSTEINSVVILLVGFVSLYVFAPLLYRQIAGFSAQIFSQGYDVTLSDNNVCDYFIGWAVQFLKITAPLFSFVAGAALLTGYFQVGFLFTGDVLIPNLSKINPLSGAKRLFSKGSLEELIKGVIKLTIVGYVCYDAIRSQLPHFLPLADQSVRQIVAFTGRTAFFVGMRAIAALLVLAVFDFAFQKWQYEKSLRMTRQEVTEEMKDIEGNPLIKSRIRNVQREMARKRMLQQVPEASVVITNPTHLAVALKYEMGTMDAPVVIAKGQRLIAEKIIAIAREHDIPIVENRPLAQALFKAVEVGMEIPVELYKAVAEVLAYIFHLKGSTVD